MSTTNENLSFEIMVSPIHLFIQQVLALKLSKKYNEKLRFIIYMLSICIMNINQNGKVLLDNCETSISNCGNKNTENCVLLFTFSTTMIY